MDKKRYRRATDKITPNIFKSQAERADLKAFGADSNLPSLHCFDKINADAKFVRDVLRTTVAMANSSGGVILFPAASDISGHDLKLKGISREYLQDMKKTLDGAIAENIVPVLDVKIWLVDVEGQENQYVLAIVIPASRACPHMMTGDNENVIYIYENARPMRARLSDIELLFQRKLNRSAKGRGVANEALHVELSEEELKVLLS